MKKSNIAILFQKHEKKKIATHTAPPILVIHEELSIPIVKDPLIASVESGILPVDGGRETPTATSTTTLPTTDEVEEEIEAVEVEPPLVAAALCLVKNKVRNSMSDRLLNDCLVTFIERDIFSSVSEDDIIHAFMAMRKRKLK